LANQQYKQNKSQLMHISSSSKIKADYDKLSTFGHPQKHQ